MITDPVQQGMQQILLGQVAKSLLDTTGDKDNPFAALLTTAIAEEVKPS
jgi:hypothetical protein